MRQMPHLPHLFRGPCSSWIVRAIRPRVSILSIKQATSINPAINSRFLSIFLKYNRTILILIHRSVEMKESAERIFSKTLREFFPVGKIDTCFATHFWGSVWPESLGPKTPKGNLKTPKKKHHFENQKTPCFWI